MFLYITIFCLGLPVQYGSVIDTLLLLYSPCLYLINLHVVFPPSFVFDFVCSAILNFLTTVAYMMDFRSADGDSDLLIIGHSFVRRLCEYVRSPRHDFDADLGLQAQYKHVFYHGIGGLTLSKLFHEIPLVRELAPRVVIIDIGTNDLSRDNVLPATLAARIVECATFVAAVDSVAEVLIYQILPRVLTFRPHGRRWKPTRADFNNARFSVSRSIEV